MLLEQLGYHDDLQRIRECKGVKRKAIETASSVFPLRLLHTLRACLFIVCVCYSTLSVGAITCRFLGSQRTCRHLFSRRRLLSKRMDEQETDSLGKKRESSLDVGANHTVPVARPVLACACCSWFLADQLCRPVQETWLPHRDSWEKLPHKHVRLLSSVLLRSDLTVGMLHRSVLWPTGYLQLLCLSIQGRLRMQACSEENRAEDRSKLATAPSIKTGKTSDTSVALCGESSDDEPGVLSD